MTREQAIAIRNALNSFINKIVDNPIEINENTTIKNNFKSFLIFFFIILFPPILLFISFSKPH